VAIRPDPASGGAFMHGLVRRLEADRKTKGLFRVWMVTDIATGRSVVWIRSK
jgi:hypothetical protein